MNFWQQMHEHAAQEREKVKVGDRYKRFNGCGHSEFEIVFVAYAHVVLWSTSEDEYGERTCSPFVESINYLLNRDVKFPYLPVQQVNIDL